MLKINDLRRKLAVTALVALYAIVLYIFDIPCIILTLTGHRCPGCGMTRAMLALMGLDFAEAFAYNRMFWSLPILYWCFLKDGRVFTNKALNIVLYTVIAVLFAVNVAFC